MKIYISTIVFSFILISCGPRSGVHEEKVTEDNIIYATVDTSSPKYKEELKLSETYEKGRKLFRQNCAVCHASRTDQMLTGPGLKGLADRLPKPAENWFIKYTLNNDSVFKSGDKYAKKLRAESGGAEMTIFSGILSEKETKQIYVYLTSPPIQRGCIIED
jgi:mono/diheme cytochrome c family protein